MEDLLVLAGGVILIFTLQMLNITLLTVRVSLVARGIETWATVVSFVEALAFVMAIALVVQSLGNVVSVVAYSAGFAAGTLTGIKVENRMALGYTTVHIFSRPSGHQVADALREAGFGATIARGRGRSGPVDMIISVVPRRQALRVGDIAKSVDDDAFVSYEDTRAVTRGWLGLLARGARV